uniref:Rieske (2Fe-2S) domain-containing protein (HcaC, bphF) n=4 Tax=environmental samples TaxID=651140 RepID=A0A075GXZ3_9ARCH|nr:Rieske (2Fe-2S) domain-containing protein (hcaC, bphF) [uncultured marine thaumarchaeote AD1000_41_B03]AIF03008.1 Rieske (2Fe-2S) domain-containing protein (hcaC, bphF) [uncultured marine thaumarchaeote KM3_160_B06]AIF07078.1 Rieske (2Fe-2S) domain-containing protein (hcaC, bphF) [uncultured marine thaumarchaeote KM3_199_D03]AIF07112.1 Rieske (2Fe-2S) domain-containing protein (hcaC, bphF) [uncultured marine thaumarchaeote KM3_199_E03]
MGRIIVAKTNEIKPNQIKQVSIDGKDIVVMNIDGNYFAINDTCTHAGGSLSEGKVEGSIITCDWHGAQFDCKSGKLIKFPAKINDLESYNVVIESDTIFVET